MPVTTPTATIAQTAAAVVRPWTSWPIPRHTSPAPRKPTPVTMPPITRPTSAKVSSAAAVKAAAPTVISANVR